MSSETQGADVDIQAVTREGATSGVPHGDVLTAFAEASVRGDEPALARAREALRDAMGPAAVVDAAGVIGNFQRMVRIADGTGIPLDRPVAVFSADLRQELGIDEFGAAGNTPAVGGLARFVARLARPLVRVVMSGYARKPAAPR